MVDSLEKRGIEPTTSPTRGHRGHRLTTFTATEMDNLINKSCHVPTTLQLCIKGHAQIVFCSTSAAAKSWMKTERVFFLKQKALRAKRYVTLGQVSSSKRVRLGAHGLLYREKWSVSLGVCIVPVPVSSRVTLSSTNTSTVVTYSIPLKRSRLLYFSNV